MNILNKTMSVVFKFRRISLFLRIRFSIILSRDYLEVATAAVVLPGAGINAHRFCDKPKFMINVMTLNLKLSISHF